jgi:hypothetical protein
MASGDVVLQYVSMGVTGVTSVEASSPAETVDQSVTFQGEAAGATPTNLRSDSFTLSFQLSDETQVTPTLFDGTKQYTLTITEV